MDFETAYYSGIVVGAALLLWLYRGDVRRLWSRLPAPWASGAALLIGFTAAGAVAGYPLIGLLVGLLGAALVVARPSVNQSMGAAADYVDDEEGEDGRSATPVRVAEQPERPQIVQAERPPNGDHLTLEDTIRVDSAARLLAAGVQGEAAAIELLFDGVKRGGSKRYQQIRDAVRLYAAARYDWRPPAPAEELAPAPLKPVSGAPQPPGQQYAGQAIQEFAETP